MAVESPADIFFIGHNRLSIEAGLYARFLGYRVTILGAGLSRSIATEDSASWNLEKCTTPLGLKAVESHGMTIGGDEIVDSSSLFQQYVNAIENSDLLAESITDDCQSIAVEIGESQLPEKMEEDVEYDTRIFELAITTKSGGATSFEADVLIDIRDAKEVNELKVSTHFTVESGDSNHSETDGPNRLLTSIDDFYLMGAQTVASVLEISFAAGLGQIVDLFKILCDRPTLDLYK